MSVRPARPVHKKNPDHLYSLYKSSQDHCQPIKREKGKREKEKKRKREIEKKRKREKGIKRKKGKREKDKKI